MTKNRLTVPRTTFAVGAGLIIALAVAEIAFYPQLAWLINHWIGNGIGPGSSMGYFWNVYVMPTATVFAAAALVWLWYSAKRSLRTFRFTLGGLLVANLLSLIFSALWYFRAIEAAAGSTTR